MTKPVKYVAKSDAATTVIQIDGQKSTLNQEPEVQYIHSISNWSLNWDCTQKNGIRHLDVPSVQLAIDNANKTHPRTKFNGKLVPFPIWSFEDFGQFGKGVLL